MKVLKATFTILFLLVLNGPLLFGQYNNVNLLAQSPDGKTVKLAWFVTKWNSEITGFDVKRKEGLQKWVKLNAEPILPEISLQKKISVVEAEPQAESMIKSKLFKLIATHKITAIDHDSYVKNFMTNDKALRDLSDMIAQDYDLALISGFAYVDHTVSRKTAYQYGVFIAGTDVMLDSVLWSYGQIPDLNTVTGITSQATKGGLGIHIMWDADLNKIKSADVAGFNIYREGIRLNSTPITSANSKDKSEFIWYDRSANCAWPIQYSISAESIFGIEGIIKSYNYNPDDHPAEYKKTAITRVASLGYYFKDGIEVQWNFPKEYERFLKGFSVEKDNMPGGYRQVSPLLDPSARVFVDKSESPVSAYIRLRVNAVFADKTIAWGREKLYFYFPVREPPPPQKLTAQSVSGDKKITVYLTWDPRMDGDTITDRYKVYVAEPLSDKFELVSDAKSVKSNKYTYVIQHGSPGLYRFCISALTRGEDESPMSDTVGVQSSSMELPQPVIEKVTVDKDIALIEWQYPDISDLRGFRLFQDKVLIASERQLKKKMFQFITSKLDEGKTYEFTLRAIAENGVLSDFSKPYPVIIRKSVQK